MGESCEVVLIIGHGRSGSTLLDRILGKCPDSFSAGELHSMWRWAGKENRLCGCGVPFRDCSFWRGVTRDVFGSETEKGIHRAYTLWSRVARPKHLVQLMFPRIRTPSYRKYLGEYKSLLAGVFEAILRLSGSSVLIDSSKSPMHGFILSEMPEVRLHALHLIRDSRGVAHSNQRKKRNPAAYWTDTLMDRKGPVRTSTTWVAYNILSGAVLRRADRKCCVRYEDLVTEPKATVATISQELSLGVDPNELFAEDHSIDLGANHLVSGNPVRFTDGPVNVRLDDAWRQEMGQVTRLLVTGLTWPVLRRHGYT